VVRRRKSAAPSVPADLDRVHDPAYPWLRPDALVEHRAYGVGTVLGFKGNGSMRCAHINFPSGPREVLVVFATVDLRAYRA